MKKLTLAFLMVVAGGSLFALPTFNPMGPALLKEGFFFDCGEERDCCQPVPEMDWCDFTNWCDKDLAEMFGIRLGYYGNFVFDRKLEVDDSQAPEANKGATVHQTSLNTNSAFLGVSMMDRFELFTTLGASRAYLRAVGAVFGPDVDTNVEHELWTDSDFAWSIGGTAILWSCDCIAVGFNGQYFKTTPSISKLVSNEDDDFSVDMVKGHDFKYSEWQVSLGASWWVHLSSTGDTGLVPYFSLKYAQAKAESNRYESGVKANITNIWNLESSQGFGYVLGATLVGGNRTNITVEGSWLNEKAVHVNGQIRF